MDVHRLYEILRLKFLQKNWGKRIFPGISLDYYNFSSTNELFKSSSLIIPGIHVDYNIYTIPLYKPWKIIYMPLFKIGYQHYISKHEFYTPTVEGREWKSYSTYRPMINYSLENSFLIQKNYYVSFMIDYKMIFEDTIRNAFTFKLLTGYNF